MYPIEYYNDMRKSKDPRYNRLKMVEYAIEHGNKPAARVFNTTVKTVRLWRRRYEKDGYDGLIDKSRAPRNPHNKITPEQRSKAIKLKKLLKSFGAKRIKRDFSLTISVKAILRIWREHKLIRLKRKKRKRKNDLRKMKAEWKVFEQIDIDVKHLYDIPEYWIQMRKLGLPKYLYTARDVVSGATFTAFADECCLSYATLFADIIIDHLLKCGVQLSGSRIQTDNGSEFIGSWNAKQDCSFTNTVQKTDGLQHHTIPPGAHTYQAEVESFHRIIEDEFLEVETFHSISDFLDKIATYQLWFNVARKNSYKYNKTPWDIIHEKDPNIDPKVVVSSPVLLHELWKQKFENNIHRGLRCYSTSLF
jgi:transposase